VLRRFARAVAAEVAAGFRQPMDDAAWGRLRDATYRLRARDARRVYAAFGALVASPAAPIDVAMVDLLGDHSAAAFCRRFLDNGRWMNYLADAIDEPVRSRRHAHAVARAEEWRADRDAQRDAAQHAAHEARRRLEHRASASDAFAKHADQLRSALPQIHWDDVAATPRAAWRDVRLSTLTDAQRLALHHVMLQPELAARLRDATETI